MTIPTQTIAFINGSFLLSRHIYDVITTVNGPVPNHFYFKAYSK